MAGGFSTWGSLENDECTTPNIRSGKSCYPGKGSTGSSMGSASDNDKDSIKVPMEIEKH